MLNNYKIFKEILLLMYIDNFQMINIVRLMKY